jgi:hypothetical protein
MNETNRKIMKATKHHLDNIKILSEREPSEKELEEMYSYLNTCFLCGEPITFWNRLTFNVQHSFCGNSHKRCGGKTR